MGFYCTFALIIANSLFPFVLLLNFSFMNKHYIWFTLVPECTFSFDAVYSISYCKVMRGKNS